ncbi:MAG TPA: phytanoyl-CoA dioxygenase family protein [Planctomycetota bacterium]|nr:phytanoyl-CoA dioxygenase family protein [Planctomycetota bacterium]
MLTQEAINLDSHLKQFEKDGYTAVEGALSDAELETLRTAFDAVIEREKELGPRRGWHNDQYVATYNMAQKSKAFWPLLEHPLFNAWMKRSLGENFVVSQFNAHGMKPGGVDQDLHIDQDESTPGVTACVQGLFTLDDFTIETGCTRLIPGSHKRAWSYAEYRKHRADFESETIRVEAPAGSFVSWHGGIIHGGSANRTAKPRRCITMFCIRPWIRVHCDYTRSMSPDVIGALNENQKRRLGFFATPAWYNYTTDERIPAKS